MTREEYLAEMHGYLDSVYDTFDEYNKIVIDIFNEFHRVCKKNNITYYSAFGTLLALIRDKSLIVPWDKDCDVLLPITQRESLIEALKKDLGDLYFFDSIETNSDFRLMMLRVGKKGYNLDTFHLDVYYLVGAPDSEEEQSQMQNEIRALLRRHERKTTFKKQKILVQLYGKPHIYLSALLCKMQTMFDDPIKDYQKLCIRYPYAEAKSYITIGAGAEVFPVAFFEPKREITVDGVESFIPNAPEDFLTKRYGNYKKYLPISARFDEFYVGYRDAKESCDREKVAASRDFKQ